MVQVVNKSSEPFDLLLIRFGLVDLIFKILAQLSILRLSPILLIPHLLRPSLQVHDLQLVLVLPRLAPDLFSLERVHHLLHPLVFVPDLRHLLLHRPLQVAVTVYLSDHPLDLLIPLPESPPEFLDDSRLLPLLLPLLLHVARDVLVLPLHLDASADARLDLETLLLEGLQLLNEACVLQHDRTVLGVQLCQLVFRQVTLRLQLLHLGLESRTVVVDSHCLLDLLLSRLREVFQLGFQWTQLKKFSLICQLISLNFANLSLLLCQLL